MPSLPSDSVLGDARALAASGSWRALAAMLESQISADSRDGEVALLYGEARMRCGEEREALTWLRLAEQVLRENGDRTAHRRAVNMIGAAYLAIGDLDAATTAFAEALELATQHDDFILMGHASNNLGLIANLQGKREMALSHYRLALPTFQRLGKRLELAACYHNIAITFRDLEQLEEADEHERHAIEYATEGAVPRFACMSRIGRAEIALRRGDAPLAEMTARLAAEELMRLGDPQNEADARRLVGAACAAQQKYVDALESLDAALAIAQARGHALNEAETLRDRAHVRVNQREKALAIADAKAAVAIFSKLGAVAECEALEQRLEQLA